jgi:hypothetical protein
MLAEDEGEDENEEEDVDPLEGVGELAFGGGANLRLGFRPELPVELRTILESDNRLFVLGLLRRLLDNRWLAKNPEIEFMDPVLKAPNPESTRVELTDDSEQVLVCPVLVAVGTIGLRRICLAAKL